MAKKSAPVWAIDIGQAALKALKLSPETPEKGPDYIQADAFDFVEYPKILSQPDADPEELVREALATFLGRNDLTGCRVALGVSGQAGLVKFIKLPPVEKKRIPDIVKFEARQQIPFALEEVIWSYQQIGGDEDGEEEESFTLAEVGLFAMKRDQINRAIQPLKNAGIEVDIVQMGPIALYNFATADRKPEKGSDEGSVVYVDVGADNSDLIITDGSRIWQRNVPIGGNHFTRALTKELKLTFAKAEHLKRNATKAADPKAVFTAMRGVFNDFSSEINRSIGFYSSVNRTAKIQKVVGLGNGFKLPGLQKFLQQNLSYDVEKLEAFERLDGDEVLTAPQFVENLPSFAIAYGLAAQGLGRATMKTNLLPPEIEQVRMVRRKKPWALAASTLLMVGFSGLFFANWNAWAKATSESFDTAVKSADGASQKGERFAADFKKAKDEFDATKAKGTALVDASSDAPPWPALLQQITRALPDPAREYKLDAGDPKNFDFLAKLNVHVDSVTPVWRTDLDTGWFSSEDMTEKIKTTMHAYDRANAPKGEGWVIQVVGHHYNPYYDSDKMPPTAKEIALGPSRFLQRRVLPRFWVPAQRAFGISHAALTWMTIDDKWTTGKPEPSALAAMLQKETPKASESETGATAGGSRSASFAAAGRGMPGMGMAGMGGMGMAGMMGRTSYGQGFGRSRMGGTAKKDEKAPEVTHLTRTDFKIDFLWQPRKPGDKPPDLAEIQKQLEEAAAKNQGAIRAFTPADDKALVQASEEKTAKIMAEDEAARAAAAGSDPKAGTPPPAGGTPPPPGGPPK